MKMSFPIKLGLLMVLLLTSLTGSILLYFYNYSKDVMLNDMRESIEDVSHTGSFVFDESARDVMTTLRDDLYSALPSGFNKTVLEFAKKNRKGEFKEILSSQTSTYFQGTENFETLIQKLRRVQLGSQSQVEPLSAIPQQNMIINCDMSTTELIDRNAPLSSIRWAYLLVPIPGISTNTALMFLADSNYLGTSGEVSNPIGNVYLSNESISTSFETGQIAVSNWYKDEFDPCVSVMTAVVPIKNSDGDILALLGVDYPVTKFEERLRNLTSVGINIFGVTVLLTLFFTFVISVWVSVPLSRLRVGAQQLTKKDFDHKVIVNSSDEFGLLALTINQVSDTMKNFTQNMEDLVAMRTHSLAAATHRVEELNQRLEQENAFLGSEVEAVIKLRRSRMANLGKSVNINGYMVSFHYLASRAICGDFWVFSDDQSEPVLHYGNASGYGLETAIIAMQTQAILQKNEHEQLADYASECDKFICDINQLDATCHMVKLFSMKLLQDSILLLGTGITPIKFSQQSASAIGLQATTPLGLSNMSLGEAVEVSLHPNEYLLIYSAGFRRAVCLLSNCPDDGLDDISFIRLTGLLHCTPQELSEKLKDAYWNDDLRDDISFILIGKGNA